MKSLSQYVQNAPLTTEQLLGFARALLAKIGEDHALDIVHGALEPDRVAWDGADSVAIEPGRCDPRWHSPEQCRGSEPTARSDVFQIGVLLYVAATGEYPFDEDIESDEPRPPGHLRKELALEWDGIIACCLHKKAEQRFASAIDVEAQVLALAKSGGTRRKVWRMRWGRVVLVAVAGAGFAWFVIRWLT